MPDNPALIAWAARALREVELPTGTRVKVRIPSSATLIRNGAMPANLRSVALRGAAEGPVTDDVLTEAIEYMAFMTSRTLRALWVEDTEEWIPLDLTLEQVDELDLPADDLDAIREIAQRQATPEQITARSRLARRLITESEAVSVEEEEADDTVNGWKGFRGKPGEPDAGDDGSDVRPAPELDAGDPGAAGGTDG